MNEQILAGRYRLQDSVGGKPDLFHAEDESLQRKVAVKILAGEGTGVSRQRWEQEIAKAAGLHYPHLLSIYDVVVEADHIYLITEDLEGETLSRWLRATAPLKPEVTVDLIRQLAGSVVQAEKHGLLEISIDPSAVLVTHEGLLKVISYGPLFSGTAPTFRQLLQTLGALLYEMLTGRTYSEFTSTRQVIEDVHQALAPYASEFSWLPERLEQVTFRALGILAEGSYGAVSDLFRDIKAVHHALGQQLEARTKTPEPEQEYNLPPRGKQPEKAKGAEGLLAKKIAQVRQMDLAKKANQKQMFKRTPFTYVFALLAIVIVSGGIWWTMAEKSNATTETVAPSAGDAMTMPDLTNKTRTQATQVLSQDGFSKDLIQWVYQPSDDKTSQGKIYRQSIDPNTKVNKNNQVLILTINGDPSQMASDNSVEDNSSSNNTNSNNSGTNNNDSNSSSTASAQQGQIPDLHGLARSDAEQLLLKIGYRYSYTIQPGGDTKSGTVYRQDPPAGTQAEKGTRVSFYVNP